MREVALDILRINREDSILRAEYETLVMESTTLQSGEVDWTNLHKELVRTAEWTDVAATHLVSLVRDYGSFMLRNAWALALAAKTEDGEMDF